MSGIGYAAAFLGGLFSLVSPCGALLLPAFFAYAFPGRRELLGRTLLFYLGLCAVLVPLGMGSAQVSRLFYGRQELLVAVAGWTLIGLGVLQVAGQGWAFGPLERLRGHLRGDSAWAVVALGAVSGLAGFCAGPVLGAVLTVAAASGDGLRGAVLLALYAAGMAAPLLVLSGVWQRYDLGGRRWLRGRGLRVGRLRTHTTSLLSGLVFGGLGALFLLSDGTRALAVPIPDSWEERLEGLAVQAQEVLPDLAVVGLAAAAVAAVTVWRLRRHGRQNATGRQNAAEGPDATGGRDAGERQDVRERRDGADRQDAAQP
ncbi:cytochrome c biogenesis CcdA family protein [Nonomuraea rhizosphaerae]|uniref:cytochrome c biogenesis CcdA family protein n=1 Tax=Nonomuraea rhizosphaerae TaxID=2665663 RepID=UPI001C5E803F|nr:cytochrome c biogenesis CcdA family protein [Nonomuraea rhizosphaerae]